MTVLTTRDEQARQAELARLKKIRDEVDTSMQRFIDDRIKQLELPQPPLTKGGSL